LDTRTDVAHPGGFLSSYKNLYFPAILAVFVLISRILCRGPLYFADGPEYVGAIVAKTYIIQPPGYWLFCRFAGLFSDPVLAITAMNIFFSMAGVVVFYYTACLFTGRVNAFLAALSYSTIFYIWFSGEIHSTYASQILFPVATYYALLCYERDRAKWMLWLAALMYAIGAGMRPSDGVFMIPLVFYFAAFRMPRKEAVLFVSVIVLLCMGWVIPTWLAIKHYGGGLQQFGGYIASITTTQSLLTGVRMHTLANPVRYILPLLFGFWPILGIALRNLVRNRSDWRIKALLIWIVPGSLFFVLILITCPPYLNFLTAAILLLAVSAPRRLMVVTALWNSLLFLASGPVPSQKLAVNVVNSFVLRCTRGGIEQQYNATLTELQHYQGNE
jgi:4-amino-4-deoxy-L-arabinose transferase-like glycosyltransferase